MLRLYELADLLEKAVPWKSKKIQMSAVLPGTNWTLKCYFEHPLDRSPVLSGSEKVSMIIEHSSPK